MKRNPLNGMISKGSSETTTSKESQDQVQCDQWYLNENKFK